MQKKDKTEVTEKRGPGRPRRGATESMILRLPVGTFARIDALADNRTEFVRHALDREFNRLEKR